jgi:hypothetical protein
MLDFFADCGGIFQVRHNKGGMLLICCVAVCFYSLLLIFSFSAYLIIPGVGSQSLKALTPSTGGRKMRRYGRAKRTTGAKARRK